MKLNKNTIIFSIVLSTLMLGTAIQPVSAAHSNYNQTSAKTKPKSKPAAQNANSKAVIAELKRLRSQNKRSSLTEVNGLDISSQYRAEHLAAIKNSNTVGWGTVHPNSYAGENIVTVPDSKNAKTNAINIIKKLYLDKNDPYLRHRKNMLNPFYIATGVGVAKGSDGNLYAVQTFSGIHPNSKDKVEQIHDYYNYYFQKGESAKYKSHYDMTK
ncbi:CAP domain-containing protein [Xylocopilactobacillus apis]|uniref:SCP domain-containing protein n=1 Tax=Xylocopilactobacillus apis TaxID=2932183 RepID=A0AAU9D7T5_9LACO|nr:CAP domain-containing protein [Xylocopilactobacillus apis]BDR57456.1 hypothetical protein KIMC2_20180 [Xylocopilactobacillus apis]BDR57505.1 hypothetical protein KIMC2_20670 [Xylocopilactobacillus apis]